MKHSVIGFLIADISNIDESAHNHFNNCSLIIQTENLLFYIDMMKLNSFEEQFIVIDDDFNEPNGDDILELNRNQYANEIRSIIESYDAKWISYQSAKSQNSNPFDTDDHIISSIERV